jgi:hypothetical protein
MVTDSNDSIAEQIAQTSPTGEPREPLLLDQQINFESSRLATGLDEDSIDFSISLEGSSESNDGN